MVTHGAILQMTALTEPIKLHTEPCIACIDFHHINCQKTKIVLVAALKLQLKTLYNSQNKQQGNSVLMFCGKQELIMLYVQLKRMERCVKYGGI